MALNAALSALRLPQRTRWSQLPREARDTLFLLAVIAWVLLPHLPHRPAWCTVLAAGVLAWRAWLAVRAAPLPGRLPVVGVLAVSAALTWWSEGTLLGREPGITLLVVLMALKTLELRARRDAMVALFLGFFLVLTQFLYSQSMGIAAAALLAAWGLMTALALSHMSGPRPALRRAAGVAARAALLGLPAMVVLFLFFPRIGPLWGLPQDASGRTGLSGTLRLGEMAQIAQDDTIALRVRFTGAAPPPQALYFRGPVLSVFDGREWTRTTPAWGRPPPGRSEVRPLGTPVDYEVTLEPSTLAVLPTPGRRRWSRDACWSSRATSSGPPCSHWPSACASGRGPGPSTSTAGAAARWRCARRWPCRRATTRARWNGPPRCGATRAMPRPRAPCC